MQYIKQHTSEKTVCRILETSTRLYHAELANWCSDFVAERLLSLPVDTTFLEKVWQLECFESCVKDNKAVSVRFHRTTLVLLFALSLISTRTQHLRAVVAVWTAHGMHYLLLSSPPGTTGRACVASTQNR